MSTIDELAKKLQPHYSHFDVTNRLLFTGHSRRCLARYCAGRPKESFNISPNQVDNKWDTAFKKQIFSRDYLRSYYDDPNGLYCLSENTHHLLVSWLSSFDWKDTPKVITTDGEFHSMSRQLLRLQAGGIADRYDGC
ncbi:MAG: hypothetical protein U5K69_02560 [Balneolaceae bacterium]|nr:hypothetical protein [Balneolaceae bacterium]